MAKGSKHKSCKVAVPSTVTIHLSIDTEFLQRQETDTGYFKGRQWIENLRFYALLKQCFIHMRQQNGGFKRL